MNDNRFSRVVDPVHQTSEVCDGKVRLPESSIVSEDEIKQYVNIGGSWDSPDGMDYAGLTDHFYDPGGERCSEVGFRISRSVDVFKQIGETT